MKLVNKPARSVVDSLHCAQWMISDFKIAFLLSERVIMEIERLSCAPDWYNDPVVADTYIGRLNQCFTSIQKYYTTFNILPQVGDRLYGEDMGMIVQERSIDGQLMTVTFTVCY